MDTVNGNVGQQVVVNIRAQSFIEMISAQGSIDFDTAELHFIQISHYGLASLNASNFGTSQSSSGVIIFSWSDPTLSGTTLANDSDFFSLQFSITSNACQNSVLSFSNSPTTLEFVDTSFNVLSNYIVQSGMVRPSGASVVPTIAVQGSNNICSGIPVSYTATITNGGNAPVYQWKINGINAGNDSSTLTTSALNNGAVVSCALTSNLVCASPDTAISNTIVVTVSSSLVPSVVVSSSDTSSCFGDPVYFSATPANGGTTPAYQWIKNGNNVGSNSSSYRDSALNNNDSIWVIMTSSFACANPSVAVGNKIIMTVNPIPSSPVASSNSPISNGDSIKLTSSSILGVTYKWNGPNGFSSVQQNPTIPNATTAMNGSYNVVTMSADGCKSNPVIVMVTINAVPDFFTLYMDTVHGIAGQQIEIEVKAKNFIHMLSTQGTISFDTAQLHFAQISHFGLASLNSSNFGISGFANGNISFSWADPLLQGVFLHDDSVFFSIQFTLSSAACSNSTLIFTSTPTALEFVDTSYRPFDSITLQPGLVIPSGGVAIPTIHISGNSIVCPGIPANYSATITNGGNAPTYQWKINDLMAGSNSNSFTTSALTNGSTVSCVITSSLTCASPDTASSNHISVTVGVNVVPAVIVTASQITICQGTPVTFTAAPTNGGASPNYLWKKDGNTVGENQASYTDSTLNNFDSVMVLMVSNNACANPILAYSNATVVMVNSKVVPSVLITASEANICQGTPVIFMATVTNGGSSPTFQWRKNGNNVGSNEATYKDSTLSNNDSVSMTLNSDVLCASPASIASNVLTITVNPLPSTPTITQSNDTLFSSSLTGNQWYLNGTLISGATSQVYAPQTNGNYQVIVTDGNSCNSDTSNNIPYVHMGNQNIPDLSIKVYPNPANDMLFVESANSIIESIELVNMVDQTIAVNQVMLSNYRLSLNGMAPGSYFLVIHTLNGTVKKRVTIIND